MGVSMAVAYGYDIQIVNAIIGVICLVPIAVSVHLINEYADYETDRLTRRTPFSGGSGALIETNIPRQFALHAAAIFAGIGLVLLAVAHPILPMVASVLLIGILILGWEYSVGPLRLAWRGLGEVTNAVLGGILLPVYGFALLAGEIIPEAVLAPLPFTLVVFVNLLETNWPDRHADAAVGKRTLATRWSQPRILTVYALSSIAAIGSVIILIGSVLPPTVAILTLAPMIGLIWGIFRYTRRETPLPAVLTMIAVVILMTIGWLAVADIEMSSIPDMFQ